MSLRRIVTVASGKGGVGKSTFAINFALTLSRVAPTILIDLDMGTSSIRNTVDATVRRDLYHFFRRGEPLDGCLTQLSAKLDPRGDFRNFAFIASPLHAMDEFIHLSEQHRTRLMHAINGLPATYVILDLRAGLDASVLDFLPHSNSGILVFTPHHPAATAAAADIVKALLFRKLRLLFAADGPLASGGGAGHQLGTINALLDQVEDSYDTRIPNLDSFLIDLHEAFGDAPIVRAMAENLASFNVHFVLNLFDGVRESFDGVVAPFVTSLHAQVSSQLAIHNLGWIVNSEEVHLGNCRRHPVVLQGRTGQPKEVASLLTDLDMLVGKSPSPPPPRPGHLPDYLMSIDPTRVLLDQLDVLDAMYREPAALQVRNNFAYIARRTLHLLGSLPPEHLGQRRLLGRLEWFQALLAPDGSLTPADGDGAGGAPLP
jgi:MinD-like ATPase involved in chromosome partitioning or flagellar assembly